MENYKSMPFPFASVTVIHNDGTIDSIDETASTPEQVMEFCKRNLEKLNKKRK